MRYVWLTLEWLFAIIFFVLTASMLLLGNWPHALVMGLAAVLCLPPVHTSIKRRLGWAMHPILRLVVVLILLGVFAHLLLETESDSIYKSPEVKARLMELYDEKMKDWPVPYEDVFVTSQYGTVHVIVSGSYDAPPLLLLHASGVASWSWKFNAEDLSRRYRIYAIDLIGDAGKSEYASLAHIMKNGRDQAELYAEITDQLGVGKAFIVGASEGGFIATNYALSHPERVEKMALLGPMGYSGTMQSVIRIMVAQFFPLKSIQENTFRWAFSGDPRLEGEFGEWFRLVMTGCIPAKVRPVSLPAEKRRSLRVPVLFVFGERDNLVGDPKAAQELVQDIPDVRVEVVSAGHLLAAEQPDHVNALVTDFFDGE